jgi:type I restriction enzyme S subunit
LPNFDKIQKLSQGSTVPGIRREELLNLQIPFCPQDEQKEVVNEIETKLAVILESMKAVDIGLKMSERLRQSILSTAFKGQLVLQNLNDESAERLLKRIKAERASNKNNGQLELSCYVK